MLLIVAAAASFAAGSSSAVSHGPGAIVRPVNTSLPSIAGPAALGRKLTGSRGTWSGTRPIRFAQQWRRCKRARGGLFRHRGRAGARLRADRGRHRREAALPRHGDERARLAHRRLTRDRRPAGAEPRDRGRGRHRVRLGGRHAHDVPPAGDVGSARRAGPDRGARPRRHPVRERRAGELQRATTTRPGAV